MKKITLALLVALSTNSYSQTITLHSVNEYSNPTQDRELLINESITAVRDSTAIRFFIGEKKILGISLKDTEYLLVDDRIVYKKNSTCLGWIASEDSRELESILSLSKKRL
jgi:hypothetical protein